MGAILEQRDRVLARSQLFWPRILFLLILIAGLLFAGHWEFQESQQRDTILGFLHAPDGEFTVMVNGQSPRNPEAVLGALRGLHYEAGHHSDRINKFFVTVQRGQRVFQLTLGRDSSRSHEYWVSLESRDAIWQVGRIDTSIFDGQ